MIHFRPILRVSGVLLIILSFFMLSAVPVSMAYGSSDLYSFIWSALICLAIGIPLWLFNSRKEGANIGKREGYLIVAIGWIGMAAFGMLPFLFAGVFSSFHDAFFETASGLTTTGASVLQNIEAVPEGILYWRSLTQWIGGMGIIVLTVAILPLLGIGGIELFVAESPGPTSDKVHPRIRESAKRLWLIYVGLTLLLWVLLWLEGMSSFDALNHALTTLSTGGFSTKNSSVAHFDSPWIHYTIILFMMAGGTNFTIHYFLIKRQFAVVWKSEEFKTYLLLIFSLTLFVAIALYLHHDKDPELAFRESLFQVVSLITTTGYITADYAHWGTGIVMLMFLCLFLGGCAGSTSGGIKIIRHLVFIKNSYLEFKRILHPRAIVPLKISGEVVAPRIMTHIIIFLLLYLILTLLGSLGLSMMGIDFSTAVGATATSIGNVGPAIGHLGPTDNFAWLPAEAKWLLAFLMIMGRLELFTIVVLFTPFFWKSN
jgi:trk system potassium uptake protein TrkH